MIRLALNDFPASWPVRIAGWFGALAVLVATLLAADPGAHAQLHEDAHDADHACAVTLALQGFCDTSAQPPAVTLPVGCEIACATAPRSFSWASPTYWHQPAHAPPSS